MTDEQDVPKRRHRIVAFGEALIDELPTGPVVGGAPLNFAIRSAELLRHLGGLADLITRIGSDERGRQIWELLERSGVSMSGIQVDPARPSGWVEVSVHQGQPDYRIAEDVAWDYIVANDANQQLATEAAVFYFGTLAQRSEVSAATLERLLGHASTARKLLDLNLRRPYPKTDQIEWSLRQADVLKCNEGELDWLATTFQWTIDDGSGDPRVAIADRLQREFQLDAVFWTRGERGCVWQQGLQLTHARVPKIDAEEDADAVGAGDAAAAALAVGMSAGWDPADIVDLANWCGAYVASRRGATAAMPPAELEERLRHLGSR